MGQLEANNRINVRRATIQKAVLGAVAAAGFLSIALVAPNALKMMRAFGITKKGPRIDSVNRAWQRLVKNDLLKFESGHLRVTEKGQIELRLAEAHNYRFKRPRRWDRKWRVLIFDIKETRRILRDKLRRTLTAIGFKMLQQSVWIYPYDCEDLIALLKADFKIGKDVLYMIVDQLENDRWLRKEFGIE